MDNPKCIIYNNKPNSITFIVTNCAMVKKNRSVKLR